MPPVIRGHIARRRKARYRLTSGACGARGSPPGAAEAALRVPAPTPKRCSIVGAGAHLFPRRSGRSRRRGPVTVACCARLQPMRMMRAERVTERIDVRTGVVVGRRVTGRDGEEREDPRCGGSQGRAAVLPSAIGRYGNVVVKTHRDANARRRRGDERRCSPRGAPARWPGVGTTIVQSGASWRLPVTRMPLPR